MTPPAPDDAGLRAVVGAHLEYHERISKTMTIQRTALGSALIPVTAYILVSAVECWRRYPELMDAISAAMPASEIGARGRRPGSQVDAVHLWSIANMPLIGRQVLTPVGLLDPDTELGRLATVFGFWEDAARAFRSDGHLQAFDAGLVVPRYDDAIVAELVDGCRPVDADRAPRLAATNALLTSFLFLLYFDTRAGYQDTGPYPLPGGRTLLVRDFNEFGVSHFPWSVEVCADLPHSNLTLALVLDDVAVAVNDWGTSVTEPGDYFPHVVSAGLFDGTGGTLRPVPLDSLADIGAAVKDAQRRLYRLIAGMTRAEKIDAGAYVYFTFLRPFAVAAGVADELDWTVPRDSLDLYELLSLFDETPPIDPDVPYYLPLA
jgi:hypothetical protein